MLTQPAILVFDGDSISAGIGAPIGLGLDAQVAAALGFSASLHNVAAGGRPVYECLARFETAIAPLKAANAPLAVIAFHAGDNDLLLGRNAEETYFAFSEYVRKAHAQGWKVVVTTELQIFSFSQEMQAELRSYNELLLRNTAGADVVIDLDLEPVLADPLARGNGAHFGPDEIHPNERGYALLARPIAQAVNGMWSARAPRRKAVLYGEVQVLALYRLLTKSVDDADCAEFELYFADSNDDAEAGRILDLPDSLLVLQVNPERPNVQEACLRLMRQTAAGRCLPIPMLRCRCLWPFDRYEEYAPGPETLARYTRGDVNLRDLARRNEDPQTAAQNYAAIDLATRVDLDRLWQADLAEWTRLDEICGSQLRPYLEANFKDRKMFNSLKLPSNPALSPIIEAVAVHLDLPAEVCAALQRNLGHAGLLQPDTPVHPSVAAHFKMTWAGEDTAFDIHGVAVRYVEWAREYVKLQAISPEDSARGDQGQRSLTAFASLSDCKMALDAIPAEAIDPFVRACVAHFGQSKAQLFQDLFVLHRLNFKRGGFFVEFGAMDGIHLSNTHLLEVEFGWNGVVSEPSPLWTQALRRNRRCFVDNRCVWSESGKTLPFWFDDRYPEYGTLFELRGADIHKALREASSRTVDVETVSLDDLLAEARAPAVIDYLSVDTEGSEYDILAAFTFERFRPRVITVEHNYHRENRAKIHKLLAAKGYRWEFGELSRWDDWFTLS